VGSLSSGVRRPERETDSSLRSTNSVVLVRKRTIMTERPPHFGEVSAKFADRGCRVVSATDPHGRILGFLDRSRYYFFQVSPQLYSEGWVDPVPDSLLLRKSGSARNRTRDLWICSQELWPLDHRGGPLRSTAPVNIITTWWLSKSTILNFTFSHTDVNGKFVSESS
jgi:hypothetical protein